MCIRDRGTVLHDLNRRYTQLLVDVIEAGIAGGEFRADLPAPLLRSLVYGGIEHHSWNYVCGRGALDIDSLAEQLTSLVCDGIAVRHSNPSSAPVRGAGIKHGASA